MSLGEDAADRLAHALSETTFDAVEREGYRAEWIDEGRRIAVFPPDADEPIVYDSDDLVRAASDQEVRNAREPAESGPG
ncbi:MAG: hypothetical protein ABEJ76_00290 [Halanaeroarchaeum sp.]